MIRRTSALLLATSALAVLAASPALAAPDPIGTAQEVIDFVGSCQPAPDGTFHCH